MKTFAIVTVILAAVCGLLVAYAPPPPPAYAPPSYNYAPSSYAPVQCPQNLLIGCAPQVKYAPCAAYSPASYSVASSSSYRYAAEEEQQNFVGQPHQNKQEETLGSPLENHENALQLYRNEGTETQVGQQMPNFSKIPSNVQQNMRQMSQQIPQQTPQSKGFTQQQMRQMELPQNSGFPQQPPQHQQQQQQQQQMMTHPDMFRQQMPPNSQQFSSNLLIGSAPQVQYAPCAAYSVTERFGSALSTLGSNAEPIVGMTLDGDPLNISLENARMHYVRITIYVAIYGYILPTWTELCTGFRITDKDILTAAHCFPDGWSYAIIYFIDESKITISRHDVVQHESFDPDNSVHDICAIRLQNIPGIDVNIRLGRIRDDKRIFALGVEQRSWGRAYTTNFYEHILVAEGTVLTSAQMETNELNLIDGAFFIGLNHAKTNGGDSGGLVFHRIGKYLTRTRAIGIISSRKRRNNRSIVLVTSIDDHRQWIETNTDYRWQN